VRAAIAQHFSDLYAVDERWAANLAELLFPHENSLLREAAWGSFVIYNAPYNNVLEAMRDIYVRSAQLVDSPSHGFEWINGDPQEKLGEHIATFYWRGVIELTDELFTKYWTHAAPAVRAHFIEFLGRSARDFEALDDDVVARLTSVWETIREHDESNSAGAAFAWWFAATSLSQEWRLRELGLLLDARVRPDPAFLVAEALPAAAVEEPLAAIRLFRRLLELEPEGWTVEAWRDHIRTVLQLALGSEDPEARRVAEEMANWLGARGYSDFRRFVA
jgi:hypothetical protein